MYWNIFIAIHSFHSVHIVRKKFKIIMGRFLSTTFILIFPYMLWFHARYENIMKNVSISSQHEILETRHFTHSEVWAFPRSSEQIFFNQQTVASPWKIILGMYHWNEHQKSKNIFLSTVFILFRNDHSS